MSPFCVSHFSAVSYVSINFLGSCLVSRVVLYMNERQMDMESLSDAIQQRHLVHLHHSKDHGFKSSGYVKEAFLFTFIVSKLLIDRYTSCMK